MNYYDLISCLLIKRKISLKPLILLCFLLKDGIIKCTVLTDLKSFFVQFSIEIYHLWSGK